MGTYYTKDGFKIVVETDAERAKRELESVANTARRAARRVSFAEQEAIRNAQDEPPPSPNPPTPYTHGVHTGRYYAATTAWGARLNLGSQELGKEKFASPWAAQRAGILQARAIRKELVHGASAIGTAIGYFIIRDVARTYFMSKYVVGGNNLNLERRQAQFEAGTSSFASAASSIGGTLMMLGSMGMKFKHPYAVAAGGLTAAAGWGLASAANTGKQHDIQQEQNRDRILLELNSQRKRSERGYGQQLRDFAMQRLAETASGRAERISIASREADTATRMFRHFESDYEKRVKGLGRYKKGDESTEAGIRVREQMEEWRSRMYSARFNLEREKVLNLPKPVGAEQFTDSFAQRGMFVGAQVDVASVQQAMLEQLKGQRANWDKLLRKLDDLSRTYSRMDRASSFNNQRHLNVITN